MKKKRKLKKINPTFLFLIIIIALIIFRYFALKNNQGTSVIKISDNSSSYEPEITEIVSENENNYLDNNPIILGIYSKNSSNTKRILMSEVTKPWTYHNDIIEYNVFFTQDEEIDNTRLPICFDKYSARYVDDISNYRIGYQVNFEVEGETISKTIISPKDTESFYNYLEIYLYDGYHRKPGEWYSHTTEEEFNDETLLLGIKLTSGKEIEKINSDITLTAFSYDYTNPDEFNSNGDYRGESKYSITIKKK